MTSTLMLFFLVGLSAVGFVIALVGAFTGRRRQLEELGTPEGGDKTKARFLVFLEIAAEIPIFAFLLTYLYLSSPYSDVPLRVLEYGALAYGASSLIVGIGFCVIFMKGLKALNQAPRAFSTLVVACTATELGIIFALAGGYLFLRYPGTSLDSALFGALFLIVGSVFGSAGGVSAVSVEDYWHPREFRKVVIRVVIGGALSALMLALALIMIT